MPLRQFLEKMKDDEEFRHQIYREVLPGLVSAARAEGFEPSEEKYQELLEKYKHQLSDDQLEAVSGGCNCRWIEQCEYGGDYLVGN
jgi:predicted ribosomally synthesized peptide with nif11-like leader